nr:hypothetical protein [Tanacetum cinerariifolium]
MIYPEPKGSTQGYPLVSVKVLRKLKDGGEVSEDGTLEIVDPQELLGSILLATNDLLILDLLTGTVFLASLDFIKYTNVTTGLDALLSIGTGCDPLALESKFTPVEEISGVLETTFVEDVVLMGVFPDEGTCSVNLIFLVLFFGVIAISLVPKSLMHGQNVIVADAIDKGLRAN